jgi:hypothetical protein
MAYRVLLLLVWSRVCVVSAGRLHVTYGSLWRNDILDYVLFHT